MSTAAQRSQGMIVQVGNGTSAPLAITEITQEFSPQISSAANGLSVGTMGVFSGVVGMTQINNMTGVVLAGGTNVFVANIDTRAFTAYTSGGEFTPNAYTTVGEVLDISPGGAKVSDIDVTDLSCTAMEYFPGLVDNGDFSLSINYLETDPGQIVLRTAFQSGQFTPLKITSPQGRTYSFNAYVNEFPTMPKAAVNKVQTGSIKFRITGAVTMI